MADSQKSAILSHHFHHKTPWNCHPSQIGHSGWQKILDGPYLIAPIIIYNSFFPFVFSLVSSFRLHQKEKLLLTNVSQESSYMITLDSKNLLLSLAYSWQ